MGSTHLVVLAVGDHSLLAAQLVGTLHQRGFSVVANRAAGGSDDAWDFLYDAAAVVLACEVRDGVDPGSIPLSLERVVPVALTEGARPPSAYAHLEALELSGHLDDGVGVDELVRRLNALVEDSQRRSSFEIARSVDGAAALAGDDADVSSSLYAVAQLERLTQGVQRIGELLAGDDESTRLVRATLDEIGANYRVVLDAIDEFYAAGGGSDSLDIKALAKLKGGRLAVRIHNDRGHCKRIGARYFGEGGLRQALATQVPAETLVATDGTFRALTNADFDLFDAMDLLGGALTREARQLYALVAAGQQQEASRRFIQAQETLTPLEDALNQARLRFQDVEQALGYAQDSPEEGRIVEDHSINVYGNVVNSVLAQTIKDSRIRIQSASLPADLEQALQELVAAMDALGAQLPPDDAEAAAAELEQLTEEVTRAQPRVGIIKKCLRSLEAFGKSVSDVGLPVVQLAEKIAAWF